MKNKEEKHDFLDEYDDILITTPKLEENKIPSQKLSK
jgi:hypothetical protein